MKDSSSLRLEFYNSFVAVCEEKSFSKAAKKVGLTQGSISQHVAALEKVYGAKLLERGGEEVRGTSAGEVVLKRAYEILAAEKRIREEIAKIVGLGGNIISVAASTIPGEHLLPILIKEFRSTRPAVSFKVKVCDSDEAWRMLRDSQVNFAAVGTLVKDLGPYDAIELTTEKLVLIASPKSALATKTRVGIDEVLEHPYVSRESGSGTRREIQNMLVKSGHDWNELKVVSELGSTEAVINAVSQGVGVSIVSSIAAMKAARKKLVRVIGLTDLETSRKLFLIRRKLDTSEKQEVSTAADEFWRFTSSRVPIHLA
nr:LysR family transcriptional regulator [Candidatus Njordarchaeota archaeon]